MKIIIACFILFISFSGFSQVTAAEPTFFGQCMLDIENAEEMRNLETLMRENPYIKVVRLDTYSKRAFILTKNVDDLTEENFVSWFNEYSDNVRCVQVGQHGIDIIKPYPFEGCEN